MHAQNLLREKVHEIFSKKIQKKYATLAELARRQMYSNFYKNGLNPLYCYRHFYCINHIAFSSIITMVNKLFEINSY